MIRKWRKKHYENKKILALLLACTIMASGVPVYAADFSDGTAESVQDAESSLFGIGRQ